MTERAVQTMKHMLKKAKQVGTDPLLAMLELRNTPIDGAIGSPVQLLMGRRTRTALPIALALLKPKQLPEETPEWIQAKQNVNKQYYDHGAKPLMPLQSGDTVRMRTAGGWKPAVVLQRASEPRSYVVNTG